MVPEDFKTYYLSLSKQDQQLIIENLLGYSRDDDKIEDPNNLPLICPHCGSDQIVGYGKNITGVHRYKCKTCNKTYSSTTGKVWYHIHKKEKLAAYLHCLLSGYSIRKSAELVGISLATSFSWRHKLLTSFNDVLSNHFKGVVESDETYFLQSEKGNKNLERPSRKRGLSATRGGIND